MVFLLDFLAVILIISINALPEGSLLLWIEGDNYELVDLKNYKPTAAPITAMAWNESTNHLAVADQVFYN